MPILKLNLDELSVDTFDTAPEAIECAKPRTFEPGCTLPELCGTG